jgi:hypothetical protein
VGLLVSRPHTEEPPVSIDHQDLELITDCVRLNKALSAYVIHFWEADAGSRPPISIDDEAALSIKVRELSEALADRAHRREAIGE